MIYTYRCTQSNSAL